MPLTNKLDLSWVKVHNLLEIETIRQTGSISNMIHLACFQYDWTMRPRPLLKNIVQALMTPNCANDNMYKHYFRTKNTKYSWYKSNT